MPAHLYTVSALRFRHGVAITPDLQSLGCIRLQLVWPQFMLTKGEYKPAAAVSGHAVSDGGGVFVTRLPQCVLCLKVLQLTCLCFLTLTHRADFDTYVPCLMLTRGVFN